MTALDRQMAPEDLDDLAAFAARVARLVGP